MRFLPFGVEGVEWVQGMSGVDWVCRLGVESVRFGVHGIQGFWCYISRHLAFMLCRLQQDYPKGGLKKDSMTDMR